MKNLNRRGADPLAWANENEWQNPENAPEGEAAPVKILLIDDDPIFCKRVAAAAKKVNVGLTICKSLADLIALPSRPNFDAALVDYYFGDKLTAFQLVHLLGENTPVVLISNSDIGKLSGNYWPAAVRSFVQKSRGIEAILAEAFLSAKWGHILPALSEYRQRVPWLPFAKARPVFIAAVAIMLLVVLFLAYHKVTVPNSVWRIYDAYPFR